MPFVPFVATPNAPRLVNVPAGRTKPAWNFPAVRDPQVADSLEGVAAPDVAWFRMWVGTCLTLPPSPSLLQFSPSALTAKIPHLACHV